MHEVSSYYFLQVQTVGSIFIEFLDLIPFLQFLLLHDSSCIKFPNVFFFFLQLPTMLIMCTISVLCVAVLQKRQSMMHVIEIKTCNLRVCLSRMSKLIAIVSRDCVYQSLAVHFD